MLLEFVEVLGVPFMEVPAKPGAVDDGEALSMVSLAASPSLPLQAAARTIGTTDTTN